MERLTNKNPNDPQGRSLQALRDQNLKSSFKSEERWTMVVKFTNRARFKGLMHATENKPLPIQFLKCRVLIKCPYNFHIELQ